MLDDDAPPCWKEAAARGDECWFCNGEACGTCGAGLGSHPTDGNGNLIVCEHDVLERHQGPFYAGP